MAKAEFVFIDGTKMNFEGTAEEVFHFMEKYKKQTKSKVPRISKDGPTSRIRELIKTNYFSEKRSINDIVDKLKEMGFIYEQSGISSQLTKLTKKRELRRLRENGKWFYVNP